jgi:hypothetical protein
MGQELVTVELPPVAFGALPPVPGFEPPVAFAELPPVPRPCPPVLEGFVVPTTELPPVDPTTVEVSVIELEPPVLLEVSSPAAPATAVVLNVPADPPVS